MTEGSAMPISAEICAMRPHDVLFARIQANQTRMDGVQKINFPHLIFAALYHDQPF